MGQYTKEAEAPKDKLPEPTDFESKYSHQGPSQPILGRDLSNWFETNKEKILKSWIIMDPMYMMYFNAYKGKLCKNLFKWVELWIFSSWN